MPWPFAYTFFAQYMNSLEMARRSSDTLPFTRRWLGMADCGRKLVLEQDLLVLDRAPRARVAQVVLAVDLVDADGVILFFLAELRPDVGPDLFDVLLLDGP